jgi:hypothetical protein
MPKKIKLNLEDLKVESFVTALNYKEKDRIKGGSAHYLVPLEVQSYLCWGWDDSNYSCICPTYDGDTCDDCFG